MLQGSQIPLQLSIFIDKHIFRMQKPDIDSGGGAGRMRSAMGKVWIFLPIFLVSSAVAQPNAETEINAVTRITDSLSIPERWYTVQLSAHILSAEAQSQVERIEGLGYSPIYTEYETPWNRVFFGRFELAADAFAYAQVLDQTGVAPGAWVRSRLNTDGLTDFVNTGDLPSIFNSESVPFDGPGILWDPVNSLIWHQAESIDYRMLAEGASGESYEAVGLLGLAVELIRDGRRSEALPLQMRVARGEVPTTPSQRLQACWYAAFSLQALGRTVEAYRAYSEALTMCGSNESRAMLLVDVAWMIHELARQGNGRMSDYRRYSHRAFERISPSSASLIKRRSTLELMYLESYGLEENWEAAAELCEQYIRDYSSLGEDTPLRDLSAVLTQAGEYYRHLGDYDGALRCYEVVLSSIPATAEQFAGVNPHAQALVGIAQIAYLTGDTEYGDEVVTDLVTGFRGDVTVERMVRDLRNQVRAGLRPNLASVEVIADVER